MYTSCLPLTSSNEYVHAVGQYMKPFDSTPKSTRGGGGGDGGAGGLLNKRESDLRCHSFTIDGDRKRFQCKQILHNM